MLKSLNINEIIDLIDQFKCKKMKKYIYFMQGTRTCYFYIRKQFFLVTVIYFSYIHIYI